MLINDERVDVDVACDDDVFCRDFYLYDDDEPRGGDGGDKPFSPPVDGDEFEQLVEAHDEQPSQLVFPVQSKHQLLESEQHMLGLTKLPMPRLRF